DGVACVTRINWSPCRRGCRPATRRSSCARQPCHLLTPRQVPQPDGPVAAPVARRLQSGWKAAAKTSSVCPRRPWHLPLPCPPEGERVFLVPSPLSLLLI